MTVAGLAAPPYAATVASPWYVLCCFCLLASLALVSTPVAQVSTILRLLQFKLPEALARAAEINSTINQ